MGQTSRRLQRITRVGLVITPPPGFSTLVLDEQFTSLASNRWRAYDNSTFGAPSRIQRYMAYNAIAGSTPSLGATQGNSLRLKSIRENVGGNTFTAGMLDSKSAGFWLPLYCYIEIRHKIPHGQGLWPAAWLTARTGGANTCEFDLMEYFHSQVPGKYSITLHRTNNAGVFEANVAKNFGGTFFEAPTYTPQWVTMSTSILPENGIDASAGVRFTAYLAGTQVWTYLDTQASWWTTNGSSDPAAFWNIYLQGCQIDGNYVGHPDDNLGYSHWLNSCLTYNDPSTPPLCRTNYGGYAIQRAGGPGGTAIITGQDTTTYEIDYIRVWTR